MQAGQHRASSMRGGEPDRPALIAQPSARLGMNLRGRRKAKTSKGLQSWDTLGHCCGEFKASSRLLSRLRSHFPPLDSANARVMWWAALWLPPTARGTTTTWSEPLPKATYVLNIVWVSKMKLVYRTERSLCRMGIWGIPTATPKDPKRIRSENLFSVTFGICLR